jgi:hypothetical protein
MPLDATAYQNLIVMAVGDSPSGIVASQIATLWALNDDQPNEKLQFLFTKLAAIDLLMGTVREQVNATGLGGVRVELSKKLDALATMRSAVEGDIDRLIASGVAFDSSQVAASGQLITTAPINPPCPGQPDGNAGRYRGDLYERPRRRLP